MNSTEMPVLRLTADSIRISFLSSGKRHLILTGSRKTGKTALLSELAPAPIPGITTWAEPGKAVYLMDNITKERAQIGIYRDDLPGEENKMTTVPQGFCTLGIAALERCARDNGEWVSIDEIGYLESGCPEYCGGIKRLMEKKRIVAAIRKQSVPFLEELCRRDDVFTVDLDDPFGNMGCVIMASGMSKRFGSNKLMADFCGQPMIRRIIDATEGIFSRRVAVTRYENVAAVCREYGIETVLHSMPYRSDTVCLGLEAVGDVQGCMFCPGDQPLLRRETVASLALTAKNVPAEIWRPACGSTVGLPVLFPRWTFPELLSLPEGKGGGYVIKNHPQHLRTVNIRDGYELMDADCPDDLRKLAEQYEITHRRRI